jgi:hypothetical protein
VSESRYDVFAIGLGAEIKAEQLREIGKNGTTMAADRGAVVKAFDTIGARIEASTKSYYLLSYCSPARAGKHEVRIEAVAKLGNDEQTGDLRSEFDATGFTPNCDPNTPPTFDVTKGDALMPKPAPERHPDPTRPPPTAGPANKPPPAPKEPPKAAPKEEFTP